MDTEQSIYREFVDGDLAFLDAIEALQRIGFHPKDAERMVDEWADANEEHPNTCTCEGCRFWGA